MRKNYNKQLPLPETTQAHPKVMELERISTILSDNANIYELVAQDLVQSVNNAGANGMSVEQIVRAAIIKQTEGFSYEELTFHLEDSRAYRTFCKFAFDERYAKSTLNGNIKAITAATWKKINLALLEYAAKTDIENGRKVRIDCTVVESNIHAPYDSDLLWDSVRVLTRLLNQTRNELPGLQFTFMDHSRGSKRRCLEIMNAKNAKERKKIYRKLLKLASKTVGYAEAGQHALQSFTGGTIEQMILVNDIRKNLAHYLPLIRQIICQTTRRVIGGESVPAQEKLVSLFEPHTDIIVKDRRDTYYGHKICLTGGASNLILDCTILEGNPADSTLTSTMLERQEEIYNQPPAKVALDGGFASKKNLEDAKKMGIKDVCFSKGRGLQEEDMCRSVYVYKMLKKFRAGIESGISWLKRSFGLDRCMWKGHDSFKSYVWASIVSANLMILARKELA